MDSAKSKESDANSSVLSRLHCHFLRDNPALTPLLTKIMDKLLLSESRAPLEGGEGVAVTADSPYDPNRVTINVERRTYLRNNFGRDGESQSDGSIVGAVHCCAYGTGCGRTTHGIPDRSVAVQRHCYDWLI